MKRYDVGEVMDLTDMVEHPKGDYVLYSDMLKETIPRPSPEAARKAVDEYGDAMEDYCLCKEEFEDKYLIRIRQKKAALLRLMGVENA